MLEKLKKPLISKIEHPSMKTDLQSGLCNKYSISNHICSTKKRFTVNVYRIKALKVVAEAMQPKNRKVLK